MSRIVPATVHLCSASLEIEVEADPVSALSPGEGARVAPVNASRSGLAEAEAVQGQRDGTAIHLSNKHY